MAITFKEDWTSGAGKFISVLRDGQAFGRIFHTAGVYQFYEGEQATLGGAALEGVDLGVLETAIQSRYEGQGR